MNDPASHQACSAALSAKEDASHGAVTPAQDDCELLRRYADEGSESAFTELVRRHVDLVYAAALRRTGGDSHRAADVSQQVFTTLARDARKLSRHTVLGAWLHTATRNAALNLMISESRRQAREIAALDPAIVSSGGASPDWERLRPVIDAAIDELPEADRAAVVLRFLERRAFADIGATLHVSEDAARIRTDRALDKLRAALARRGITSTAAALGAAVASQPLVAAPAGLAATLASQSLATASAGGGFLATLVSIMNLKIIITAALSALVFFGVGTYVGLMQGFDAAPPPPLETPRQAQMIAALRQSNQSLKAEVDRLNADAIRLHAASAQLVAQRAAPPPPASGAAIAALRAASQKKAIMNNLRQTSAALEQFTLDNGRPPSSINELVGETKYIRRQIAVAGENYAMLSLVPGQPLTVTTANGETVTFDPTGATTTKIETPPVTPEIARLMELSQRITPSVKQAVEAYTAAHNGTPPSESNLEVLIPYFATPQEGADFVEALAAKKAAGL